MSAHENSDPKSSPYVLLGIVFLLAATGVLGRAALASQDPNLEGQLLLLPLAVVAVYLISVSVGLFKRRRWGYIMGLVFACANVAFTLLFIFGLTFSEQPLKGAIAYLFGAALLLGIVLLPLRQILPGGHAVPGPSAKN